MRHSFRVVSLAAMLGAIAFLGFGCQSTAVQVQQQATRRVSLQMWTVFDDVDALQAAVSTFRASRPYMDITIRQFRPEDLYQNLIEALASDQGPDILSVSNRMLGTYVSKLTPLPATVHDTTVSVQHGQFGDTTVVTPQTLPTVTLDQLQREFVTVVAADAVRNGQIYGLPASLDTMAVYYNKDLLDRAQIPEPPKTWEDFQADVKKLTKYDRATGKITQAGAALGTGTTVPWSDDVLGILFKQSNVSFVDRNGRAVFNSRPSGNNNGETAAMSVMNFYTDFANPTRDTYTWNDSMGNGLDSFIAGKTAFFFGYSFHNAIIKSRAPQLNYDILPLFQLNPDQPVNAAYYSLETVLSKSKHQNEAWDFIIYLTHSVATKNYLDRTGRPTARRAYISDQQKNLTLSPFVAQLLTATNWYRGSNYDAAAGAVRDLIRDWLVPSPDPDKIFEYRQNLLNRAVERVNQTL